MRFQCGRWYIQFSNQTKTIEALEQRIAALESKLFDADRVKTEQSNRRSDMFKKMIAGVKLDPVPPVDRAKIILTSGGHVTEDHKEIDEKTGQQKAYIVLTPEERSRGFVRPVRRSYVHTTCGTETTMSLALAETYARDPKFYGGTFCVLCATHRPLSEFVWSGTQEQVGS